MFRSPEGIATDNAYQRIYVVDTGNDRVQVDKKYCLQKSNKYLDNLHYLTIIILHLNNV